MLKHLASQWSISDVVSQFDVTPTVSDLWSLKYAYLGQVTYQHSGIGVAVKRMLVELIQCEIWTYEWWGYCIKTIVLCHVSFKYDILVYEYS